MARRPSGVMGFSSPPTVQPFVVPASMGGVNTIDSRMGMPPQDCVYTHNLMPVERGLRLREGYREWTNNLSGDVRTIIPYQSQTGDSTKDKLFAASTAGIYDITTREVHAGTKLITFGTTTTTAGYGVKCEFTNDASLHYLFYADALNGLYQYTEAAGWAAPVGGTSAGEWYYDLGAGDVAFPIADVAFVMVFKQRIWVILEDQDDAWYLPIAAIAGELTKFVFGAKLPHGGDLMGLWNWTVDGGDGVDDMLIAVSRGGDIAVYQGADPSLDDFGALGEWFIGGTPASRRLVASYGSEMYVLSTFGITSLRDLLQGADPADLRTSPSSKINLTLRSHIQNDVTDNEWSLNIHPADGFMQIVTPDPGTDDYIQYNQNLSTKAWGFWEGVPMICADTWKGEYYFGAASGVVYQYSGALDGALLDGTTGENIGYRILTSFQAPSNHGTFKRAGFVRTITLGGTVPSFNAEIVYDYAENAIIAQSTLVPLTSSALWDAAVWDVDTWGLATAAVSFTKGGLGIGRTMAVAMSGTANVRIEIIGWDVFFTEGGLL
jgi:hypothetical protein